MEKELITFDNGLKVSQYIEPNFSMLTVWHDVPGLRRSVSTFYNLKEQETIFVLDYIKGLLKDLSYEDVKEQLDLIK